MNRHNQTFYGLECADEILDVVGPLHNRGKEISEAMSALTRLRYGLLKERYTLFDLLRRTGCPRRPAGS